jgi:hypothetical protein
MSELEDAVATLRTCVAEMDVRTLARIMADPQINDDLMRGLDAFGGG